MLQRIKILVGYYCFTSLYIKISLRTWLPLKMLTNRLEWLADTWLTELPRQGNSFRTRSAKATRRTFTHSLRICLLGGWVQLHQLRFNKCQTAPKIGQWPQYLSLDFVVSQECQHVRQWLLLRMNGRVWEHGIPLMCRSAENARDWVATDIDEVTLVSGIQKHSAHQRCGLLRRELCSNMGSNLQMPQCHSMSRSALAIYQVDTGSNSWSMFHAG